MFWEKLISPVTGIINKVLDKIAGDKISEKEKAELAIKAHKLASEELQKQEDAFRKFVLDYEGAAKDMPRFIQILRGSVRPVLTYVLAGFWIWGYAYMFVTPQIPPDKLQQLNDIMALLFKLNLLSLGFWYGERLLTRTGLAEIFRTKKENPKKPDQ